MTVLEFEELCCETGFGFACREMVPIGSSGPACMVSSALIQFARMCKFFASVATYPLKK